MSLKQIINYNSRETDGSQVLEDNHHIVARDQLIPRIIERNKQAVATDRRLFLFYMKKQAGRRCSCFSIDTSPSGHCPICYGNGVVGGYDKYGTVSETFDVTFPNIASVNIRPDFESQTRPLMFTLDPSALSGHLELEFDVRTNIAWSSDTSRCRRPEDAVDLTQIIANINPGNSVKAFIRSTKESGFVPLTDRSLGERLTDHRLILRIEMSRTSPARELPVLSHVFIRYKLCDELKIRMDIPRENQSITLAEYGIFDSWTTINAWLADTLRKVGTEDFFVRLDDGTRWKVIESSPNKPLRQVTSHDLTLRLIMGYEQYIKVP